MEELIKRYNKFVVVDIETSHFHPDKGAMIIEIGAVKIENGKVVDEFVSLINPERKITDKITEITGITNDMLTNQPTYKEVLPSFHNFCKGCVMVAHNSSFDWNRFLLHFYGKVGIYPKNPIIDTLRLAKKYFPKNKNGYKLQSLCELTGVVNKDGHRALSDARATAEIFLYMVNNLIDLTPNNQLSLINAPAFKEDKIIHQTVRKVAYWEKQVTKNKMMKRAYVTLDQSVVFFDIPSSSWAVKSSNINLDFEQIEKDVVKHLNLNNISEIESYFAM